ncbi:MAG: RNA-processing protein [Candidatus Lokiarchaeota archaeon]|nr:RNA-processing protein [Candidatus Lokiarchaeota archaeon]MBD3201364.1 RNA-processing protein [Candidatus Lokiarchaeota archaeon]
MSILFKLNKSRVGVVIGTDGETKKQIEDKLGVEIIIESKTGDVEIKPDYESEQYDPLNVLNAKKIIKAINRGFNPVKAMKLADPEYELEIFNLISILGKSNKKLKRIKGRLIGRNGEIRKAIERFAECYVSIYGKTVAIIADFENLQIARKAINMLISGMPHHVVLKFLERRYSEKQKERFREVYKPDF